MSSDFIQARRIDTDALIQSFSEDQLRAGNDLGALSGQIPRVLHHYTTMDGLDGITNSMTLWASDVRYMNDSTELEYAAQLIDEIVADALAGASESRLRDAYVPGMANTFLTGPQPFISCFCEEGDLLSQWRGYVPGEAGVSLGFDLRFVEALQKDIFGAPGSRGLYLRKVIYDPAEQRRRVRDVVETWLQTLSHLIAADGPGHEWESVYPYPAIWSLSMALKEHHLSFKHPTFSEEREWRLIKLVDVQAEASAAEQAESEKRSAAAEQRMNALLATIGRRPIARTDLRTLPQRFAVEGIPVRFRPTPLALVPYVALKLESTAGTHMGQLPLTQVVQGPAPHAELSLESLHMFLRFRGYGIHTSLSASSIPLRR